MDAVEIIRTYNVSITEAARQFAEARRILGDDSLLQAAEFFAKHRAQELPGIRDEIHFGKLFRASKHTLNDAKGKPRVKIVHNGLRHSFCSYRMAETKSAAQVALEAGNSPKILFEH